ncbi:MAG: site-2 protease family protein [Abditibacteriota bacterium]|nr:site-2 protease family protein [Abditibacteriota bacterium]MBP5739086.1 site-2 protease family protein [Abditibacteriota bacterium]
MHLDITGIILTLVSLIICIDIHEFAHAYSALCCGDDTAQKAGRVSLNPADHLDRLGTVMMIISTLTGFGFGWGKPVPVNSRNFRDPRAGTFWVSVWGPLSNLLTALLTGTILRFCGRYLNAGCKDFLVIMTLISLVLAFFNLIPVAPLDGSKIVIALLPYDKAVRYNNFCMRYGTLILLGVVLFFPGIISSILTPPMLFCFNLFTGGMTF